HLYTVEAAIDVAALHLEHRRHRAACEVVQRFVARGDWRERVTAQRLDSRIGELLLIGVRAAALASDRTTLDELLALAREMHADERLDLEPNIHWMEAKHAIARGDWATAAPELTAYEVALRSMESTEEVLDRRIEVMRERLTVARERGLGPQFFDFAYRTLANLEPHSSVPLVERLRYRIANDDPEGALLDLRQAQRLARHDEEVLRLQAEAEEKSRE